MEYNLKNAIEQMRDKEEAGINYIYSKTYNYVYLRAKSILKREMDVQQLVKNVYLKMIEEASQIEEETLYDWLGRNAYILGGGYYRKKNVREAKCLEIEMEEVSLEKVPNTDLAVEAIEKCLEDLPDMYQATAYAFCYDYLPITQIAELLGCSVGTVISRLNYVRRYMIKLLENSAEETGKEMSWNFGIVRDAFCKWSDKNCLETDVAQAVYADICRGIGLHAEAIQQTDKEFTGVNNTIVSYDVNDLVSIQKEIRLYNKKTIGSKKIFIIAIAGIFGATVLTGVIAIIVVLLISFGSGKDTKESKKDVEPQKIEELQKEEKEEIEIEEPETDKTETELPVEVEQETVSDESEYIFPESSTRALTRAEIEGHTKEELRLARNEIFARHGMIFGVDDLIEYFSSKSWYKPTIPGDEFYDRVEMSMIEEANIVLIQEVEDGM